MRSGLPADARVFPALGTAPFPAIVKYRHTKQMKRWLAPIRLAPLHGAVTFMCCLFVGVVSHSQDTPHGTGCADCHINHDEFGNQFLSTLGNENVCLTCHVSGGKASRQPFWAGDQAAPVPGQGAALKGNGRSHRWDSTVSARVEPVGAASFAAVTPLGLYTGQYARSYTITVSTAGNLDTARFDWSADAPTSNSATNLPLHIRVIVDIDSEGYITYESAPAPLESGVSLQFNGNYFRAGDQWRVFVRPDLTAPTNPDVLFTMTAGTVSCSACHDQHSQSATPFDPNAPASGAGRHFMRMNTPQDQLCAQCHGTRFVTNAVAGSHPVGVLVASNTAYSRPATLPLDKTGGTMSCSTCHEVHNSASTDGNLLREANQPELCGQCHKSVDVKSPARHLMPLDGTLWPGGQYGSLMPADKDPEHRGSCGNCHRVHGWPDAANPTNAYPNLLAEREENLCFTCHDGSPVGKNLKANFAKTFRHPVATAGRHTTREDGNPASYGTANRHSECADCHNVHALGTDSVPSIAPGASANLKGVSRVSVTNISPGVVAYQFRGTDDPTPVKEYELCFNCHSSWTTQPSGQSNLAADLNTLNASFHPVEGPGKNLNINPLSFVNGWNATKMMTCTDCHASDDTTIRGPHGSSWQYILKKQAIASPARRSVVMANTELCFDCHSFDTYANTSASSTVRNYSRFSGGNGHAYHVGSQRYACYTCHETHGTTTLPNLLVTGRSPGINTYTRTASGGTCVATCHGSESYSVSYAR